MEMATRPGSALLCAAAIGAGRLELRSAACVPELTPLQRCGSPLELNALLHLIVIDRVEPLDDIRPRVYHVNVQTGGTCKPC